MIAKNVSTRKLAITLGVLVADLQTYRHWKADEFLHHICDNQTPQRFIHLASAQRKRQNKIAKKHGNAFPGWKETLAFPDLIFDCFLVGFPGDQNVPDPAMHSGCPEGEHQGGPDHHHSRHLPQSHGKHATQDAVVCGLWSRAAATWSIDLVRVATF